MTGNGRAHGAKWNEPSPTTPNVAKEGDVYMLKLEGNPVLWMPSRKSDD